MPSGVLLAQAGVAEAKVEELEPLREQSYEHPGRVPRAPLGVGLEVLFCSCAGHGRLQSS